ncbi:MAG: histidine-type phosphatase [Bacteroidales bacterium]|nr:histidine-type phosphatase [Bacteroidales bacterium]
MKKLFALFVFACAAIAVFAQGVPDTELSRNIRQMPQRASTNVHSYEFAPLYDTPAPKGYKPFYISHYGRHGSRSDGKEKNYIKLREQLAAAAREDQLTKDGLRLYVATKEIASQFNGMPGRLTPRGRREHAAIAERMYHRYPAVFKKGSKKITARSSTVPRCIVSMNAFTNRLIALQSDLDIDLDTGEAFMKYIGRGDNKEIREATAPVLDSLYNAYPQDTTAILARLFKDPDYARSHIQSVYRLQRNVYQVAKAAEAFDINENLFDLLPEEAVYRWSDCSSMSMYLRQCNSLMMGDVRMPRARLLVDDIVRRADEVIAGAERAADLRFGHDWPFLGLVCYFGLEGVSERMTLQEAQGKWVGGIYTPFAANFQIIFYRKPGAEVLVKFLMNEKETMVPELTAVSGPYYRWNDVKARLQKL